LRSRADSRALTAARARPWIKGLGAFRGHL
jgi:hypothetical protein